MGNDDDLLSATLTRRQWTEIRKALKTRRTYLNKGIREGTLEQVDRLMVDAIIDQIAAMLSDELDE